uniref:DOMON domain-containing protein n=1 Tax=Panagrellus redivivus TaxID=6233 RepID=A0A7E4VIE8_PANRE
MNNTIRLTFATFAQASVLSANKTDFDLIYTLVWIGVEADSQGGVGLYDSKRVNLETIPFFIDGGGLPKCREALSLSVS